MLDKWVRQQCYLCFNARGVLYELWQVLMMAAHRDDDIFMAAAAWALAYAITLGSDMPMVPVAQISGLMRAAKAAEKRLVCWSMRTAVHAISAFAREPMQQVPAEAPPGAIAFLCVPELRELPRSLKYRQRTPQQCAGCSTAFLHVLRCGRCKATYYCSARCQQSDWKAHGQLCQQKGC